MDKLLIGVVVKPHGVVGQVKVKILADSFSVLKNVKTVYIDGSPRKVLSIKQNQDACNMTISECADRDAAELLRGKELYAERSEIKKKNDEFFIVDVIDSALYLTDGKLIGKISEITSAAVDVYTVTDGEKRIVFPMIKALKPIYDIENKRVTVDKDRFYEVALYED